MKIRPIDIARKLGVSTSALRHYEAWGIVPKAERSPSGYRIFTEEHVAYFECVRAMSEGFGMELTKDALHDVRRGMLDEALWKVSEAVSALVRQKQGAEQTVRVLDSTKLDHLEARGRKRGMTIGEASAETGVPASAIRHWDAMGLIEASRNSDNGYRTFSPAELSRIMIIRTLRATVWSLDIIREVMKEYDLGNLEQARRIARQSLQFLNDKIRLQVRGIHYLHLLIEALEDQAGSRSK